MIEIERNLDKAIVKVQLDETGSHAGLSSDSLAHHRPHNLLNPRAAFVVKLRIENHVDAPLRSSSYRP